MADDNLMSQDEIERLLNQKQAASASPPAATQSVGDTASLDQNAIESMLAGGASRSAATATAKMPAGGDDTDKLLAQDEIEQLLQHAGKTGQPPPAVAAAPRDLPASASAPAEGDLAPRDMDYLLRQAEQALASINIAGDTSLPQGVSAFRLQELSGAPASADAASFELIRDVELDLKIELGRTHMYLEDVLKLRKGAVVPLDKLAGDPVDIHVNGRLVARGEVLVLNDNFCVRVAELIAGTGTFA